MRGLSWRRGWLKCGDYLIIDQTEAMFVIDVNSGRCLDKKNLDDNILETSMQAAGEGTGGEEEAVGDEAAKSSHDCS